MIFYGLICNQVETFLVWLKKKRFLSSCLPVPNPFTQFQTLTTSFKRQWCGRRLVIEGCTVLSHHSFAKNFAASLLYPTLQRCAAEKSRIWLLLLYQSLGVRGDLKLVLISKCVINVFKWVNLKSIASLLGATQLPSWNLVFPFWSLKATKLKFHSLLKERLQPVLLVAEAAGISILQRRGSVWWQTLAEVQSLGCSFLQWDVGQRRTSRHFSGQVSIYLFCCHSCSLYLLSLNCFSPKTRTVLYKYKSNSYNPKRQHSHF